MLTSIRTALAGAFLALTIASPTAHAQSVDVDMLQATIHGDTGLHLEGCLYTLDQPGSYLFSAEIENADAASSEPFTITLHNQHGRLINEQVFTALQAQESTSYALQLFYEDLNAAETDATTRETGRDDDARDYGVTSCTSNED